MTIVARTSSLTFQSRINGTPSTSWAHNPLVLVRTRGGGRRSGHRKEGSKGNQDYTQKAPASTKPSRRKKPWTGTTGLGGVRKRLDQPKLEEPPGKHPPKPSHPNPGTHFFMLEPKSSRNAYICGALLSPVPKQCLHMLNVLHTCAVAMLTYAEHPAHKGMVPFSTSAFSEASLIPTRK